MKYIGGLVLCLLLCLPSTLLGESLATDGLPALIWLSENVKVSPYAQVGFQWVGSNLNLPVENEIFPAVPIEIGVGTAG